MSVRSTASRRALFVSALTAAIAMRSTAGFSQSIAPTLRFYTGEENPSQALVGLDHDDDDDDGVADVDSEFSSRPDSPQWNDDLAAVDVRVIASASGSPLCVRVVQGEGLRVIAAQPFARAGACSEGATAAAHDGARYRVFLQGIRPSRSGGDQRLRFEIDGAARELVVTVASVALLRGDNSIVRAHRDAAPVSHRVTNDLSLPRGATWETRADDIDTVRAEVWDPGPRLGVLQFDSVSKPGRGPASARPGFRHGSLRGVSLEAPIDGLPMRSRFVRLVGDEVDERAPGAQGQALRTALRDVVRLRYRRAGLAGEAGTDLRVGRPGDETHADAALRGRFHLVVLRDRPGGRPVFGGDESNAARIAREQVTIANEVYLQCGITFGPAEEQPVEFADPPPPSLIAVGDDDGLRALGGGEVRLRVGARVIAPVAVQAGWTPLETAAAIAEAIRAAGFAPRVTLNRRTDYGAEPSADVLVRDARGALVPVGPWRPGERLSTDARQRVLIGRVDLADGLEEFNNLNSAAGTLEERALLKSLADDDPATLDVLFVNRFTNGTRIGEAFVEGDGAALVNHVILDRGGLFAQREAWTLAHEAGHVLLNQPWHPDNMGPDRPWLLMDSDASLGAVNGPKRLEVDECRRIRHESGPGAQPALLQPFDARQGPRRAPPANEVGEVAWYPRPLTATPPSAAAQSGLASATPAVRAIDHGFHIEPM